MNGGVNEKEGSLFFFQEPKRKGGKKSWGITKKKFDTLQQLFETTSQHQQTRLLKQNSQTIDVHVSFPIGSYLGFENAKIRSYNE